MKMRPAFEVEWNTSVSVLRCGFLSDSIKGAQRSLHERRRFKNEFGES